MFTATNILKLANSENISRIIIECQNAIYEEEATKKGGPSLKKRYQAAIKYIKNIGTTRPQLNGAWPEAWRGMTVQVLCNGFNGVMLFDAIEGLPEPQAKPGNAFEFHKVVDSVSWDDIEPIDINLANIRAFKKIHKEEIEPRYTIADRDFNPDNILEVADILGEVMNVKLAPGSYSPMLLVSGNGLAICLPLRKKQEG